MFCRQQRRPTAVSSGTTDGTRGGTIALASLSGAAIGPIQSANGALYFDTYNSTTNAGQIWTSDGTSSGTVAVATTGGSPIIAVDVTAVGNSVYFYGTTASPTDGTPSAQLWAINGRTGSPVAPGISFVTLAPLTALNDSTVLFAADDGSGHGQELWESDGTAAGTTMIKDVNPGLSGSVSDDNSYNAYYGSPATRQGMTVVNGVAYFIADDGTDGQELWKSDGTPGGTSMVKDIDPGPASSSPQSLTNVDGTIYFVAHDGSGANQLWKTDGTAGGTSVVQSFTPAQTGSSSPTYLSALNGKLYFSANDGVHGSQLWTSDGTQSGTTMVTNIPQSQVSSGAQITSVIGFDGAIFLETSNSIGRVSTIYRSDGAPAETTAIFTPDSSAVSMSGLTVSGNSLYFLTTESGDSGTSVDLWKSDGSSSGTTLLASVPGGSQGYYGPSRTLDECERKGVLHRRYRLDRLWRRQHPALVDRRHSRGNDRGFLRPGRTNSAIRGAGQRARLHPARRDGLGYGDLGQRRHGRRHRPDSRLSVEWRLQPRLHQLHDRRRRRSLFRGHGRNRHAALDN